MEKLAYLIVAITALGAFLVGWLKKSHFIGVMAITFVAVMAVQLPTMR